MYFFGNQSDFLNVCWFSQKQSNLAWVGLNIVYFSLQKHVLAFNQLTGKIFLSEMIRLYFIVH